MRASAVILLLTTLVGVGWSQDAEAPLRVAAAADLRFAMNDMAQAFSRKTGIRVETSYGSSAALVAQIENGAPFDLYLAADESFARKLERDGFAQAGTFRVYAYGKLALVKNGSGKVNFPGDIEKAGRIAIANPQHAPYGRVAVEALKKLGIYEKVRGRLVIAENIAQAFEFVQTGNADVGLVAMALAKADNARLEYAEVPGEFYPPLHQAAVVVKGAAAGPRALRFRDFLLAPEAAEILKRYGFGLPGKDSVKPEGK